MFTFFISTRYPKCQWLGDPSSCEGIKKGSMGKVALELDLKDGWNWRTWRRKKGTSDKGHSVTSGIERAEEQSSSGKKA